LESLHYSIEEFLGKKNVIDIVDSGGATFYIVAILLKCWRSRTSAFYRKYLAPSNELFDTSETEEEDYTQELYNLAISKLEGLHWYDKMLFQTFVDEGHSISSLSRATGIPRTSISLTINRVRKYLKKELNKAL
jgi:DNA-directed RNA polymerase specialized sigma24 family protein